MSYMVSLMGEALYQYYYSTFMIRGRLNSINQNYCEYLVWGGLRSTEVYKKQAAKDPDWANRVIAYTEAERRPAKAGQTVVSITLEPRGNQPCK